MAAPKARHASLKLIEGRGPGRDSGGRVIPAPLPFERRLPDKPDHLSPHAATMWDRVMQELPSTQLLKPIDGAALEMLCETYARWRDAVEFRKKQGLLGKNSQGVVTAPWIGIEERASRDYRGWCSEFGFTPAAEVRLQSTEVPDDDDGPF